MTDTPRPWDRRTPDSDPAYDACAAYLDTGSLRDAYRQRSGNEKALPSHRRDSQSASRHAAIREQRQRLREHLTQPGVLERHAGHHAVSRSHGVDPLHLSRHVVMGRLARDVLDLLHGPLDADAMRVRILQRALLGQLLVPHPVPWTHICAMPPGVAHTPRAPRSACDTQASRDARSGCTAPRSWPRRRGRPRGSERFGRGSLAP